MSRLIDIDSDGDLDLLAFRLSAGSLPAGTGSSPGPSSVYNNNRDGSFSDVAAELGLKMAEMPVASIVCDDLDNDRDLDLVIFPQGDRTPIIWVNDRQGVFRTADASSVGLDAKNVISATTGDPDKDGDRDLLVFSRESTQLFENVGSLRISRGTRALRLATGHFGLPVASSPIWTTTATWIWCWPTRIVATLRGARHC